MSSVSSDCTRYMAVNACACHCKGLLGVTDLLAISGTYNLLTWNAYSCPYSLLSWLRIMFVVMFGSFIASMLASARHFSHCTERLRPRLAC